MYKDIMVYVDDCDAIGNEKNTKLVKTDKTQLCEKCRNKSIKK